MKQSLHDQQSVYEHAVQRRANDALHGALADARADSAQLATTQRMIADSPRVAQLQAQHDAIADNPRHILQRQAQEEVPNRTGLPNQLKAGIESLSGMSMDHVNVHYNSAQPAQLNAHAYAQGSDIHVAPGQEQHLPHEAWHVVQQAQGRVQPTMQMHGGVAVNDDAGLESEADHMGARAASMALPASGA